MPKGKHAHMFPVCREHQHFNVMLLMADTCADDGPHNLYLLQRWFPLVLSISGEHMWTAEEHM